MKPSRNDPCPCGSGKKFKKCCLNRDDAEDKQIRAKTQASEQYQGLSFEQVQAMVLNPFERNQMVRINPQPEGVEESPIMRLLSLLLSACGGEGVRVLRSGQLNKKAVKEIALVYLGRQQFVERSKSQPLRGEADFSFLRNTRVLAEVAGLVCCHGNQLVISELGSEMMAANSKPGVYYMLFELAAEYVDWGLLGPWPSFTFIQKGFLFSLFLLTRYGGEFRPELAYRDMFLQAMWPGRNEDPKYDANGAEVAFEKAYVWRTMYFIGELFGLIERHPQSGERPPLPLVANAGVRYEVMKTKLLDQLVSFQVPDRKTKEQFAQPVILLPLLEKVRPGQNKKKASAQSAPQVEKIPEPSSYQLKISLKGARPPIWRRVLVKSKMRLHHLAQLIQAVMGWRSSLDHAFELPRAYPNSDGSELHKCHQTIIKALRGFACGGGAGQFVDSKMEKECRLDDIFTQGARKFHYLYDSDSQWAHEIVLEKILPWDESLEYPICIKGKRACPPEEFAGIKTYQRWLSLLMEVEPDSVEEAVRCLLDRDFDPVLFDLSTARVRVENLAWV